MRKSLLEAISPTAERLLAGGMEVFAIGYSWLDPVFGELEGSTVVFALDAAAALQSFRSTRRHLTGAWIIPPQTVESGLTSAATEARV